MFLELISRWTSLGRGRGFLPRVEALEERTVLNNGFLDPTFGGGGKVLTDFGGDAGVRGSVLQPDGKIVVAGFAPGAGSTSDFAVARYNGDGSLDTTFGPNHNGKVLTDFAEEGGKAQCLARQADGKIVAAGYAYVGNQVLFALVRYNPDGSLDTSFGNGGKVTTDFGGGDNHAHAVVLQPATGKVGAKIVVAGMATVGGGDEFALARYTTDGQLDTSFGNGGTITTAFDGGPDFATSVLLQPDDKIVAAGTAKGSGYGEFALARYDLNRFQIPLIDPHAITKPGPISIDPPDPPPLAGTDITSRFYIRLGKFTFDPATGRSRQKVVLRNTSTMPLVGPLTLRLDGLRSQTPLHRMKRGTSKWVTITRKEQSVHLGDQVLPPGAGLSVTLEFASRSGHRTHFEPQVFFEL